jgi:hypothetical protein
VVVSEGYEISDNADFDVFPKFGNCHVVLKVVTILAGRQEVVFKVEPAPRPGFSVVYSQFLTLRQMPTIPAPTLALA